MAKPRLLDLFCGAGGAAMGYYRAGWEVVGVDIEPQRHYPFEFIQADALEYLSETLAEGFDHIHASPPCQAYSRMRNLPWLKGREYWDSIPPTRAALIAVGKSWTIENVEDAPLDGIMLCGQMFGLAEDDGSPIYRHRLFESTEFLLAPGHPKHYRTLQAGRMLGRRGDRLAGIGAGSQWRSTGIDRSGVGHSRSEPGRWGKSIGIDWMTRDGLSQAIPPAYTELIGTQLLATLAVAA